MQRLWAVVFAALLLWAGGGYPAAPVYAVDNSVENAIQHQARAGAGNVAPVQDDGGSLAGAMVKLVFTLLVLTGIIYLGIRFVAGRTRLGIGGGNYIETLSVHPLTANRSLHLVKMGDTVFLLGVGDTVQLIERIDDPEQVERLKNMIPPRPVAGPVSPWLTRARKIWEERKVPRSEASFRHVFQETMSRIRTQREAWKGQMTDLTDRHEDQDQHEDQDRKDRDS
jgi:flagellar biogenesis protein FliO